MDRRCLLTKRGLAERWGVAIRTIDEMRRNNRLPWVTISSKAGGRGVIRFAIEDVERFEAEMRCPQTEGT